MATENDSLVTEFILVGFTDKRGLQLPLFFLFLMNYVITVMGNLSLINLICLNSCLHTSMYFFIFNLPFIDLYHSFILTPKILMSFLSEKNIISFAGCMAQLFFFVHFECYVLTAMSYDDCVAICKPLLYTVTMSPQVCSLLMLFHIGRVCWCNCPHRGHGQTISFCDSNIINHYMCDIFPLLQLSFSSTYANEVVDSIVVSTVVIVSSFIIFISYALILSNILHISSAEGWSKALSTCGSHIISVALFCGSGVFTHLQRFSVGSVGQGKFSSVFYTNVVAMLNPLIYSLWNKDVKCALKKTLKRISN